MNLKMIEFSFQSENHKEEPIEGAFFFDNDVINEEYADYIINSYGYMLDNKVFKKDAPCFFLPKAQADMLRYHWIPDKLKSVEKEVSSYLQEMRENFPSIELCIEAIQDIFQQNILVKEEDENYER